MKSYFLTGTTGRAQTEAALDELLSAQRNPWVLADRKGDAVAYIAVDSNGDVQADISGRHYDQDVVVLNLLETLRARVGGSIEHDN